MAIFEPYPSGHTIKKEETIETARMSQRLMALGKTNVHDEEIIADTYLGSPWEKASEFWKRKGV